MKLRTLLTTLTVLAALGCTNNDGGSDGASQSTFAKSDKDNTLTLYAGRSKSLVAPIIEQFEEATGIKVDVKYGNSAQLALALQEEGDKSNADVFWAQDAGALSAVAKAGLFADLPSDVSGLVTSMFASPNAAWVATSGRARVLAYSPARVSEDHLPASVSELLSPAWRDRVGWAPTNASFQSFVTAMRVAWGESRTETWLRQMKENGAKSYPKNTAIVQAIAAGEIDLGLPNHYYLLRFKKSDSGYPVEQTFFAEGDIGNLVNVAGAGILANSQRKYAALEFVKFLLGPNAQQYFASDVFEYPVIDAVIPNSRLVKTADLQTAAPNVGLADLDDLEGTLSLLRKLGLL